MYMVQEIIAKWTLRMGVYAKIHYDYIMYFQRSELGAKRNKRNSRTHAGSNSTLKLLDQLVLFIKPARHRL